MMNNSSSTTLDQYAGGARAIRRVSVQQAARQPAGTPSALARAIRALTHANRQQPRHRPWLPDERKQNSHMLTHRLHL